jgi:uncharacterized membrane protein YcaP (DUF421 family)
MLLPAIELAIRKFDTRNFFTMKEFLLGQENWSFLGETALRTVVMYVVILVALRLLGKRGVKQLSVFETVVIISLGSAAGDPMFYKDVGLLPCIVVFTLIVLAYRLTTYLVGKNERFEKIVEGECVCLIQNGKFAIHSFKKEPLAHDEFFAELRQQSISHLGQVRMAIIETSGNISVFFYADEDVKWGLPVLPDEFKNVCKAIPKQGYYSCYFCAYTEELQPAPSHTCPECKKKEWVESMNEIRIS